MVSFESGWVRVIFFLTLYVNACMATDCEINHSDPNGVAYTINVDSRGIAKFTKVQQAIDSIPSGNNKWIRIFIAHGTYMEKVVIPKDKGCLYLEGETKLPRLQTIIEWGNYTSTDTSATFTAFPDNIVFKGIGFKNTYDLSFRVGKPLKQAVAARFLGDKYAVINCRFIGLQDTLWDASGRHYFKGSYISGAIDFIWGYGQSIYEACTLNVFLKPLEPSRVNGYITAQGRESESDPSGFVFKGCTITGDKALLGRAYKAYSRVIFYQCQFPDSVIPIGWDAWNFKGHEDKITFVEEGNKGPGASTSGRVPWMKKMNPDELNKFISLSYIDQDGWMSKLPPQSLA